MTRVGRLLSLAPAALAALVIVGCGGSEPDGGLSTVASIRTSEAIPASSPDADGSAAAASDDTSGASATSAATGEPAGSCDATLEYIDPGLALTAPDFDTREENTVLKCLWTLDERGADDNATVRPMGWLIVDVESSDYGSASAAGVVLEEALRGFRGPGKGADGTIERSDRADDGLSALSTVQGSPDVYVGALTVNGQYVCKSFSVIKNGDLPGSGATDSQRGSFYEGVRRATSELCGL